QVLAFASGMNGLFGLDFLKCGDQIFPLELNPRYPASVEILEYSRRVPLLGFYNPWVSGTECGRGDPLWNSQSALGSKGQQSDAVT
ncbi:hypothetical protein NL529_30960, partial [Klebsiella pneumoniae]|nr:hypothetical protein [Klebsiella pneumoniae]